MRATGPVFDPGEAGTAPARLGRRACSPSAVGPLYLKENMMKLIWNTVRDAWSLAHVRGEDRLARDGTKDGDAEAGMATAEYAIGTLAAAAFAGLLLAIIRSGSLQGVLQGLIESALSAG